MIIAITVCEPLNPAPAKHLPRPAMDGLICLPTSCCRNNNAISLSPVSPPRSLPVSLQSSPAMTCLHILLLLPPLLLLQVWSQSTVELLPGFDGPLPFHLETGWVCLSSIVSVTVLCVLRESKSMSWIVMGLLGGPPVFGLVPSVFLRFAGLWVPAKKLSRGLGPGSTLWCLRGWVDGHRLGA